MLASSQTYAYKLANPELRDNNSTGVYCRVPMFKIFRNTTTDRQTKSSAIRMFLQRRRYLRAMVVLKAWRVDHSMPVLQCLRTEILRQKKIEMGLSGVSS